MAPTSMPLPIVSTEKLPRGSNANDASGPDVARALAAMKADPTRRWTVAELAKRAGLSRSAFARRFTLALGTSPLKWLADHRLERARQRLLETELPLAAIAVEVGYACEFAFAKAFKRRFGTPPGIFRRGVVSMAA